MYSAGTEDVLVGTIGTFVAATVLVNAAVGGMAVGSVLIGSEGGVTVDVQAVRRVVNRKERVSRV